MSVERTKTCILSGSPAFGMPVMSRLLFGFRKKLSTLQYS